ncbi:MAG: thioredoxin-disulfide reductase [Candidatus Blackburnbacteria bacterium]|nr:thioredoxin-disulfide reductase [Candidatus Blackburnbacteria bacterium]
MSPDDLIAPKPKEGEPFDVIIIGSGPAGLTAAIYTTRAALSTLIIGGTSWGGQLMLTTEVENYPGFRSILGPELMQKMRGHATSFGAEFVQQDAQAVDFRKKPFTVKADGKSYQSRSVIIATGAQTQWLGLPSEQKLIGRGVSSCAPCDAPFFRGKSVIVVGGGDSAMEEANVLTRYATAVTIIHRRDQFRASEAMQQKVLNNPKIKVLWNSEVAEILGDERVTGIKIKNNKTNEISEIPIDGIFVAIGHTPATKLYEGQIELDQKGYVKRMENGKAGTPLREGVKMENEKGEVIGSRYPTMSSVEGVFVSGDVHDYDYRQAVTAAGYGCQAAMDLEKWLEEAKEESKSR